MMEKKQSDNVHGALAQFNRKMLLTIALFMSLTHAFSQITVNSLTELLPYLDDDNVNVTLSPGTYAITAADVSLGKYGVTNFEDSKSLLMFTGDNSTYDFTGVTINISTDVFQSFGSVAVTEVHVVGNYNVLKNLTIVDLGSVDDRPKKTALGVCVDGKYNKIEGFHMTVKGSYPYGYGDAFGKGGTYTIKHYKHSAFLMRGLRNHALNCTIIHRSYGHAMFMQGASYPTIEGCYIEGEVRSTDDMLAEAGTGTPADEINFMTEWGYPLPPGYMLSTGEAGIRAYNGGNTLIDGQEISRGTDNPTILNCTIKNMRTGVTLAHATGAKYVEGCTAIGCENGYSLGSGNVVDCYADCAYGPVYSSTYENDKNYNADITIIPAEGDYYNGSGSVAYIGGSNHNITLRASEVELGENLRIKVGGDKNSIRHMYGNLPHQNDFACTGFEMKNLTNFPIVLSDKSSNVSGQSGGMITDNGTNNSISHTAVSAAKIQAEDYSDMLGVTKETTTDDGAGENVSAIDAGDWLSYAIDVPHAGTYSMDYRVASESASGELVLNIAAMDVETITFSATGGSQTWTTVRSQTPFYLTKGVQTIKIKANTAGWRINWMDLLLECAAIDIVPHVEMLNSFGTVLSDEQSLDVSVFPGNAISFKPEPVNGGSWSWTGPEGFTASTRVVELTDIQSDKSGDYVVTFTNDCGLESSKTIQVTVENTSEEFVTPCLLPVSNDGFKVENTTTDWSSGVMDISCVDAVNIYAKVSSVGTMSQSDNFKMYYKVDGGEMVTVNENTGDISETLFSAKEVSGSTLELIIQGNSGSENNYYNISEIDIVETVDPYAIIQAENFDWYNGLLIQETSDVGGGKNLCKINDGEYSMYKNIDLTGINTIHARVATEYDGGSIEVRLNAVDGTLVGTVDIPNTGDWQAWQTATASVNVVNGIYDVYMVYKTENSYLGNVNWFQLEDTSRDPLSRIEAEDYDNMSGVELESTSDTDGKFNLSWIHNNDWIMFREFDMQGLKGLEMRLSSTNSDCSVEVRLDDIDGTLVSTIKVPNTNSWNIWKTVSAAVSETEGVHDIYFVFKGGDGYLANVNWLKFDSTYSGIKNYIDRDILIFPNPVVDNLIIEGAIDLKFEIFNSVGALVIAGSADDNLQRVSMDTLITGFYTLRLTDKTGAVNTYKLIKK